LIGSRSFLVWLMSFLLQGAAADQQDLSGVQIVESMPVQINLVIPDDQVRIIFLFKA